MTNYTIPGVGGGGGKVKKLGGRATEPSRSGLGLPSTSLGQIPVSEVRVVSDATWLPIFAEANEIEGAMSATGDVNEGVTVRIDQVFLLQTWPFVTGRLSQLEQSRRQSSMVLGMSLQAVAQEFDLGLCRSTSRPIERWQEAGDMDKKGQAYEYPQRYRDPGGQLAGRSHPRSIAVSRGKFTGAANSSGVESLRSAEIEFGGRFTLGETGPAQGRRALRMLQT